MCYQVSVNPDWLKEIGLLKEGETLQTVSIHQSGRWDILVETEKDGVRRYFFGRPWTPGYEVVEEWLYYVRDKLEWEEQQRLARLDKEWEALLQAAAD